jgi:hypothetical protein
MATGYEERQQCGNRSMVDVIDRVAAGQQRHPRPPGSTARALTWWLRCSLP